MRALALRLDVSSHKVLHTRDSRSPLELLVLVPLNLFNLTALIMSPMAATPLQVILIGIHDDDSASSRLIKSLPVSLPPCKRKVEKHKAVFHAIVWPPMLFPAFTLFHTMLPSLPCLPLHLVSHFACESVPVRVKRNREVELS